MYGLGYLSGSYRVRSWLCNRLESHIHALGREWNMRVRPEVQFILQKALAREEVSRPEALELMQIDENSYEVYALAWAANTLTRRMFGDPGEVHAQVGINLWPCPKTCAFCSFGEKWRGVEVSYRA